MSKFMQSTNFELLRPSNPVLADLGGFAEQYSRPDPTSALVKLRSYIEIMVGSLYAAYGLPRSWQPNLNDLINKPPVTGVGFDSAQPTGTNSAQPTVSTVP